MPTYTSDGIYISPVQTSVQRVPVEDNLPTVTVQGHFDWKFWAGLAAGVGALYLLLRSMQHAGRKG